MKPGISIITPTQGRDTLGRLLDTVAAFGLTGADEHLVMIDVHGMDDARALEIEAFVSSYGPQWRPMRHDAGGHDWGHCQINVGLARAKPGNYIVFNDDDDIFAEGALAAVREAIAADAGHPRAHVFKFVPPWRSPIIPEGTRVARGAISGHCLVVPNLPDKVGRFGHAYDGDFDMIENTLARWGTDVVFHDQIIAIARP